MVSVPRSSDAPSRLPPGYEFVRVLGHGASGWVALAQQSGTERLVAVKIMFGGALDADGQQRLAREGQALARLRDPRIIVVYELNRAGDDLALVMEFVDGGDLADAAEAGRLDTAGRIVVLGDVAAALDHAADSEIVHRDVKPANVLVTRDGRGKLGDFGIARLGGVAAAFRTGGDVVIGTPRYMAPEQIADPAHESAAGDVYSFAVMAYELLLGRRPFPQDTAVALFHAHLFAEPIRPRDILPALSAHAEGMLLAALAKEPRQRPRASELMAALTAEPIAWGFPVPGAAQARSVRAASASAVGPVAAGRTLPFVDPSVYRPPADPRRSTVSPRLAGIVLGLLLVAVIAVLVIVSAG